MAQQAARDAVAAVESAQAAEQAGLQARLDELEQRNANRSDRASTAFTHPLANLNLLLLP